MPRMDSLDLSWFKCRFELLERLMWIALGGGVLVPLGVLVDGIAGGLVTAIGGVLVLPFVAYLYILPVLHWKDGYAGAHSSLWGALLVIETSGWFKIIYWFRHLLPSYRRARRAADRPN
jgi:hypothetical protein